MPYPDDFNSAAYDVRWDNPEVEADNAERSFIARAFITYGHPLLAALNNAEFRDSALTDLCHALAATLEAQMDEIRRRGDL